MISIVVSYWWLVLFICRIKNLVGIIDIAPTLLDIAEVAPPDQIDGKSLKPLLDDRLDSVPD